MLLAELTSDEPLRSRLDRARAAPAAPRTDLRIAVLLALLARRHEADEHLRRARSGLDASEVAGAAALAALLVGDSERALVEAERAPGDPDALALAADCLERLERAREAEEILARLAEDHPYARNVRAQLALAQAAPERAIELLSADPAGGIVGAIARRLRAEAWLARAADGDAGRARDALSEAVWHLVRIGAPGELGRCYLAMAHVEHALGGSRERAAQWLARAHPLIRRAGTPTDETRLRSAFRRFGRRAIDRLVDPDLERIIEGSRSGLARAADLARAAFGADVPSERREDLGRELLAALSSLGERDEELVSALEAILLEKESTGRLVEVCRELLVLRDPVELERALPRLALELGADAAALFRDGGDRFELIAQAGAWPERAVWDEVLASVRQGGAIQVLVRPDARLALAPIRVGGRALVLAARGAGRRGARGGGELERLGIFASVATVASERAGAEAALRQAAARDAATLEAIREGILTLDAKGVVLAINTAAASILGMDRRALEGRALASVPGLAPLVEALARGADEETVQLAHGDVLVRTRSFEGGIVATLQELERARQLAQRLVGSQARFTFDDFVGRDPQLLDVLADARRIAPTDVPVLITGESGTGKELVAQAIHNASPRAVHPFVGVNVAAIPRELLESELFGYEAGAFTGARARGYAGRFELAGAGTLLLDEIGDMPLEMQAKLLRVLQERSLVRLGGTRAIPVRSRVIATTHRDLEQAVEERAFRLDLFHRLRVVHLRLPPLRERRGDIRILCEYYLARIAARQGRPPPRIAPAVLADLERYSWPGNVRELANLLEGVVALLPPEATEIVETPAVIRRRLSAPPLSDALGGAVEPLEAVERRAILHAIHAFGGNIARAARALGVARNTLYAMLDRHGLRQEVQTPRPRSGPGPRAS
jgi:transcriptional regulator with PAS, ATPase and Fis domain